MQGADHRRTGAWLIGSRGSVATTTITGAAAIAAGLAAATGVVTMRPPFTDVGLPGLDGRQLADEAMRLRPGLPVLFTTGYARNAIAHNNVLDQGLHLLTKPFTIEQLATKIRAVLGEGRAPGPDREKLGTAPEA